MKNEKIFNVDGKEIEFAPCIVILGTHPEWGRLGAVYAHDVADESHDDDRIIYMAGSAELPEDDDDAWFMLNGAEYVTSDAETLNSVEF